MIARARRSAPRAGLAAAGVAGLIVPPTATARATGSARTRSWLARRLRARRRPRSPHAGESGDRRRAARPACSCRRSGRCVGAARVACRAARRRRARSCRSGRPGSSTSRPTTTAPASPLRCSCSRRRARSLGVARPALARRRRWRSRRCGAVFGASRHRGRLDRRSRERRERIRLELYTVNQLLAMHVRIGRRARSRRCSGSSTVAPGASSTSSTACSVAVRSGTSEPAAFRRAAELTPEPAAARTYKLFAAGAERGVDLAGGLRALSEDLRDARREEIRQTATKRRAAMLVPDDRGARAGDAPVHRRAAAVASSSVRGDAATSTSSHTVPTRPRGGHAMRLHPLSARLRPCARIAAARRAGHDDRRAARQRRAGIAALVAIWAVLQTLGLDVVDWIRGQLMT